MTDTQPPIPSTADLVHCYYTSVRAATDAFQEFGYIPEEASTTLVALSAAIEASHAMAITKRLGLIAEILEDLYPEGTPEGTHEGTPE